MNTKFLPLPRRHFLASAAFGTFGILLKTAGAAERPPVTTPRATSGDTAVEPDWGARLTVTVGTRDADLVGDDDRVLQAAVSYVARLGGGTVRVLPGTYRLRNAVHLASRVRLEGSGLDTVLMKEPSVTTKLAADSDWYDQEITLADPTGFRLGDGVCLKTQNKHKTGPDYCKRTLIARSGNRFKLDRPLRENFWQLGEASVSTLFPLLNCEEISEVVIEHLVLDGNRGANALLDGNHAGCIFAQDCSRLTFRGVTARNYNGDGISFQICHDVLVENCRSVGNTNLGLHPGSGSQRPVMRNNRLENNDIGIFFCWGVKHGLAESNVCLANRLGVSIGHRDTDNLIVGNEIRQSGHAGILFRKERGKGFAAHRNRIEKNLILDSGGERGVGIEVEGATENVSIVRNEIRETRAPMQRVGIRLGAETANIKLEANQVSGMAQDVERLKAGG
ncbi:hypothetical protein LBMAG56_34670 [Verrucomicrobiota bacterium]|nr:hypothetical protein LBMAG56_34670 [Verrucomicrobiota bacterium]